MKKKKRKRGIVYAQAAFFADEIKFVQSCSVQVHMAWQLTFGYYCDRGGEWCSRSEVGNEVKFGGNIFQKVWRSLELTVTKQISGVLCVALMFQNVNFLKKGTQGCCPARK